MGSNFFQGMGIMFLDQLNIRKTFILTSASMDISDVAGFPVYINSFPLDLKAMNWLANSSIHTIYIKSERKAEMRKFSVNNNSQAAFQNLIKCFLEDLPMTLEAEKTIPRKGCS